MKINRTRKAYLGLFLLLLTILFQGLIIDGGKFSKASEFNFETEEIKSAGFWSVSHIHIDNNWTQTRNQKVWCNGSGTEADPFVIENVTVDAGNVGTPFIIENTKDHFILKNCTIKLGAPSDDEGLLLKNVENGLIRSCHIHDNYFGVYLENTINIEFELNNISNSGAKGVEGISSHNSTFIDNLVLDNDDGGFAFTNSNWTSISNNNISYNPGGDAINLINCSYFNITGNYLKKNENAAIYIEKGYYNIISDNNVLQTSSIGIDIYQSKYCEIYRNFIANNSRGIRLWGNTFPYCSYNNISYNTVENSTASGILVYGQYCTQNVFSENIVRFSKEQGVNLIKSKNNTLLKNYIHNNTLYGINFEETNETFVKKNIIEGNGDYGIRFDGGYVTQNNTFTENTVNMSGNYGIMLPNPNNRGNHFYKNYILKSGYLYGNAWDSGKFNTWNNTKIGNYWDDYGGSDPDRDGIGNSEYVLSSGKKDSLPICGNPFYDGNAINIRGEGLTTETWWNWTSASTRAWCSGLGTYKDPYIIGDLKINIGSGTGAIYIRDSMYTSFNIENCEITNLGGAGITIWNTTNGIIRNNNISHCSYAGIYVTDDSEFQLIENNNISYCYFGIYFEEQVHWDEIYDNYIYENSHAGIRFMDQATHHEIINNKIYSNEGGIEFNSEVNYNTIEDNELSFNGYDGIELDVECSFNQIKNNKIFNHTMHGFTLIRQCDNNTIESNHIYNNSYHGFVIEEYCHNNTLKNNEIEQNKQKGLIISEWKPCNDNWIFNNYFINNGVNSWDNGSNNWYKDTTGNYWSDYIGVDLNDDNRGDSPYTIAGDAGNKDYYPLFSDGDNTPIISIVSPTEKDVFGKTAPDYKVSPFAADMDQVWYSLNDSSTTVSKLNVTVYEDSIDQTIWSNFGNGTVTIKFSINDTGGKVGFSEIVVKKDTIAPVITINTPEFNETFQEDPPQYSLEITEPHLDSVWFTLDGGLSNYTLPDNVNITVNPVEGVLNQTIWDSLPNGTITFTLYANDTVGNIGFDSVTINKEGEPPDEPIIDGVIPFGDSYLIFILIGLSSLILLTRKKITFSKK